jgi:pimeloyl-ACP methyl ester carboxylesterase
VHFAHATSFDARTYAPLLTRLAAHVNVIALDQRGHGASAGAARDLRLRGWRTFYDDLADLIAAHDTPLWLAGHSLGGMVSIGAAARHPARVAGLLLLDPAVVDPRRAWKIRLAKLVGGLRNSRYVQATLARHARFDSRAAAREALSKQAGFRHWPQAWLESYVDSGFTESADGAVELACTPHWEAHTYVNVELRPYALFRRLARTPAMPVAALVGERGSTFPVQARAALLRHLPHARVDILPDGNHYLPMLKTAAVADWLQAQIR